MASRITSRLLWSASRGYQSLRSLPVRPCGRLSSTPRKAPVSINRRMYRISPVNFADNKPEEPGFQAWVPQPVSAPTKLHWLNQDLLIGISKALPSHHEDGERLTNTVDRLIEPQTVPQFIGFMLQGSLPNGKQTEFPLLKEEEAYLLASPSKQWAPASCNTSTRSTIDDMMIRIGSFEDPSRLSTIGKNIHYNKSRLWEDLVPVSDSQWAEKDLTNPKNLDIAMQYLSSVISVFEYLNVPHIRDNMRDTFNLISNHLQDAEKALNIRRQDSGQPLLSLTRMWEEFIRAKYQQMTGRAHSWILDRIQALQKPALQEFSVFPEVSENETSPELKELTERWHGFFEMVALADLKIWISMDGYQEYQPSPSIVAGLSHPNLDSSRKAYQENFPQLAFQRLQECVMELDSHPEASKIRQSPENRVRRMLTGKVAQDELRQELRGESSPLPPLSWIQSIRSVQEMLQQQPADARPNIGFGLAIYRMAHDISDQDWTAFKTKFEAHLSAWGESVDCAEEVKQLLKLHWFDGKDLGLSGVEAARRHFQEISTSGEFARQFESKVFLVVDRTTVSSYMDPEFYPAFHENVLPGDFHGHVLAIEAGFDPSESNEHAEESPGFDGQMRVLGSLVWSDLYPMLTSQSATLWDLWPLAMEHPQQVYTGPTVPAQRDQWKAYKAARDEWLSSC